VALLRPIPGNEVNVKDGFGCHNCPALGSACEGEETGGAECGGLQGWLEILGGLELDMPLASQPAFDLLPFLPQLLNGLEVPAMIDREPVVAVGIAKALTPRGRVSRRAVPESFAPYSLRSQWGIGEGTQLVCVGNYLDPYLERLWRAQAHTNIWGRLQSLGFDASTSLNFSIYLDRPRLEHMVNIKRTWLTVQGIQETSSLIPIPHLQWATPLDLVRQLDYAQAQGFHTLTLNLQMWKCQGWEAVAAGLATIRERAPDLRLLITGVAGLKRLAELAEAFPSACFSNTTAHYLAQRYVRLRRDGTRLIKEPVEGHPDLILAENVHMYRDLLLGVHGGMPQVKPASPQALTSGQTVASILQNEFGFDPGAARDGEHLLAADEAILDAFQAWQQTGQLDRDLQSSISTCEIPLPLRWPSSECVPHPSLGELLDEGADPVDAFLYLAYLAHRVDEEIQVFVGRAGY
jgi:hypothetical protein